MKPQKVKCEKASDVCDCRDLTGITKSVLSNTSQIAGPFCLQGQQQMRLNGEDTWPGTIYV